jgi:hypothetical protein
MLKMPGIGTALTKRTLREPDRRIERRRPSGDQWNWPDPIRLKPLVIACEHQRCLM